MSKNQLKNGFTLIEMLIVVTIIGILAGIVLPRFQVSSDSARKSAHTIDRQNINAQIELYYFNTGQYPTAMTESAWSQNSQNDADYFPDGVPVTCNQGIAWTIDGITNRIDKTAHDAATHE